MFKMGGAAGLLDSLDICVPKFAALKLKKPPALWDEGPNACQMAYEMRPDFLIGKPKGASSAGKPRPARADNPEIGVEEVETINLLATDFFFSNFSTSCI